MAAFTFVVVMMFVVMVVMMMLVFVLESFFAQFVQFRGKCFFLLHRLQDAFACQLIPRSCNDGRVVVMLPDKFDALIKPLLRETICMA